MRTQKHAAPGYVPTPAGTCFVMPSLPMADGSKPTGNNWHPFVIISEGKESVECLMGRTLYEPAHNGKPEKDRTWKLSRIPGAVEINDPCPPMDPKARRRQYVDASQIMVIPKKILYESTDLEICNNSGLKLSNQEVKDLNDAAKKYGLTRNACYTDPFNYQTSDEDFSVDKYLPKKRPLPSYTPDPTKTEEKQFD